MFKIFLFAQMPQLIFNKMINFLAAGKLSFTERLFRIAFPVPVEKQGLFKSRLTFEQPSQAAFIKAAERLPRFPKSLCKDRANRRE